jgi:hypothetical protein
VQANGQSDIVPDLDQAASGVPYNVRAQQASATMEALDPNLEHISHRQAHLPHLHYG